MVVTDKEKNKILTLSFQAEYVDKVRICCLKNAAVRMKRFGTTQFQRILHNYMCHCEYRHQSGNLYIPEIAF